MSRGEDVDQVPVDALRAVSRGLDGLAARRGTPAGVATLVAVGALVSVGPLPSIHFRPSAFTGPPAKATADFESADGRRDLSEPVVPWVAKAGDEKDFLGNTSRDNCRPVASR